jgi:hypothetical protein
LDIYFNFEYYDIDFIDNIGKAILTFQELLKFNPNKRITISRKDPGISSCIIEFEKVK